MRVLLSAALLLCLLALPLAPPAVASGENVEFDAVLLVAAADLPELLASGALGDHALLAGGAEQFAEHAVLTPADLGLDQAALLGEQVGLVGVPRHFLFGFSPFFPFFRGFGTLNGTLTFMFGGATITQMFTNVRVPVFRFFPVFSSFGLLPFRFGRVLVVPVR
ncbi:MAG TPA: hypothetical protein VKZ60_06705 [Chloroflexota bacterium]|jgi:hypothetical protein|nr:hypothetical protein [Chloroflexota bacterium]